MRTPWRNGNASDSRVEGCVFESSRGQVPFVCYYLETDVKAVLNGVEIMKQLVKVKGKCCCVESFCHSLLYASVVLINIDVVKGRGWKR